MPWILAISQDRHACEFIDIVMGAFGGSDPNRLACEGHGKERARVINEPLLGKPRHRKIH